MANIVPLNDRVLVKREVVEKTAGGIIVPIQSQNNSTRGVIVATGSNVKAVVRLREGATVIIDKYKGTEIEVGGASYVLVKEEDCLAVVG